MELNTLHLGENSDRSQNGPVEGQLSPRWASNPRYGPLAKDSENMVRIPSGKKGSNFPEPRRAVMMPKVPLWGMHHHVENLQGYLAEYDYRFNEDIFDNLILRMAKAQPCPFKNISGQMPKSII